MKKLFAFILAMSIVLSCINMVTFTANAETYGDLNYEISNGEVTITYCKTSASGTLTIPATIEGYPVTSIGSYAFEDCSSLTSITIPDSVTSIGSSAFYYCSKLTSITIPDSVTSIGEDVFYSCRSLTSITIPDSVTSIGSSAFYGCSSLTSITIPDGVTSIGDSAFSDCDSLTSITIPDGVTSIGQHAFFVCSKLTSITIPDSVTSIGSSAFSATAYYNNSSNWENKVLYIDNHLIEAKETISGAYTIKDGTKTISSSAFEDCSSLTSITIPDSVKIIGSWAFSGCSSLAAVYITDIASWCSINFYDTTANPLYYAKKLYLNGALVTELVIPDSVTSIGSYAFSWCSSLTSITIPDSVTSIGEYAFAGCSGLESIIVSENNSVYYSKDNCLIEKATNTLILGCKNSIIPDSVTSIGDYAFYGCSRLTSITIPNSVTSIGSSAFSYCSSLTSITIPDSVTSIDFYAFSNCSSLTSVTIGNSVTSIGSYAFYNCSSLTNITIPDSVTSIGNSAFWYCSSLTSITIGNNLTSIGDYAFSNCNILSSIYYRGTETQWNEISISNNINLISATRYYNSCIQSATHTYDNACDVSCNVCSDIRTVPDHSYTLNDNHTCDICKYSKTPENPIVESKTNSSVTLIKYDGFEYSKDGVNWQVSNVFNNLLPDTTYTFYQRVKASSIANASEVSEGTAVTFKSAQNTPSAPVILNVTDTVITLRPIQNGEYSLDGILWQDSNVFNNLLPGTTYTFYQRYKETDSFEASNITSITFTIEKVKQTLIPTAPTVKNFSVNIITLNEVEGCEYSLDGINWQSSNVFTGLECGTEYTFYQRYKETATHYAGKKSSGTTFKTDKGTQSAPSAPTLESKTHNTVTLNKVDGYEYSLDGITWQRSNVFTGLEAETNYVFYQRKAENDKYYESESSTYLIVKTNEAPQFIYGDVNGDGLINKKDDLTLRMHLASLTVTIDLDAADVFVDGTVNKKDLLLLKQYLAGWSVQLGQ